MISFQKEDFIPNLDFILPEIHKIKLYNPIEYEKIEDKQNWPGYRSRGSGLENPFFINHLYELLKTIDVLRNKNFSLDAYLHLKFKKDEKNDDIHQDNSSHDFSGLVYLNNTNLNSGTKLFDLNDNVINDFKYVKNRLVIYSSNYRHVGYGHFGDTISNGRLTLNFFINIM